MATDHDKHQPPANADAEMLSPAQIADAPATSAGYRVKLTRLDNGQVAYLGQSGGNFAEMTSLANAAKVEIYIRIVGSNRWLSPSGQDTVAWYLGNGSTGWVRESDGKLKSQFNSQHLSIRDNGYMYAYDGYPMLKVDLEPM